MYGKVKHQITNTNYNDFDKKKNTQLSITKSAMLLNKYVVLFDYSSLVAGINFSILSQMKLLTSSFKN